MKTFLILLTYLSCEIISIAQTSDVYMRRGAAKANSDDFMGAISEYSKAIELNPNEASPYFGRGGMKNSLKDYYGAISDYNIAIKIDPTFTGAYINRAESKSALGDYRGSILDFNKAIELIPNTESIMPYFGMAYNGRGIAKTNLGDYKGAISDFNNVIDDGPEWAWPYFCRGNAKFKLNNKKEACLDWSKAGELGYKEAYETIRKFCN